MKQYFGRLQDQFYKNPAFVFALGYVISVVVKAAFVESDEE